MIPVLAQIDLEQLGATFGVIIAALGGWRGLERLIVAWRGRSSRNGEIEAPAAPAQSKSPLCADHYALVEAVHILIKTQEERDRKNDATVAEIKSSIHTVHRRIDDVYEKLIGKTKR